MSTTTVDVDGLLLSVKLLENLRSNHASFPVVLIGPDLFQEIITKFQTQYRFAKLGDGCLQWSVSICNNPEHRDRAPGPLVFKSESVPPDQIQFTKWPAAWKVVP